MISALTPSVCASSQERFSALTDLPSLGLILAITMHLRFCFWLLCSTCVRRLRYSSQYVEFGWVIATSLGSTRSASTFHVTKSGRRGEADGAKVTAFKVAPAVIFVSISGSAIPTL